MGRAVKECARWQTDDDDDEVEYRTWLVTFRRNPDHWLRDKLRLMDLEQDPPMRFKRRFLELACRFSHPEGSHRTLRFTRWGKEQLDEAQRVIAEEVTRQDRERIRAELTESPPPPRGGPPPGDGLDITMIRTALRNWDGPWPPTQDGLTDYTSRRVRQVLGDSDTDWRTELAEAKTRT